MSVNDAWQGRRFKSPEYKCFEQSAILLLGNWQPELYDKMKITIVAGFSNRNADIDNISKPILDILQKKYGFNDNKIYELNLVKEIVKKGSEFIKIKIEEL